MNPKVLFKTLFLVIVALLLVLMGMNNKSTVKLALPPVLSHAIEQPAAIMYVGFFGLGFVSGSVLFAGGGGRRGSSKPKSD